MNYNDGQVSGMPKDDQYVITDRKVKSQIAKGIPPEALTAIIDQYLSSAKGKESLAKSMVEHIQAKMWKAPPRKRHIPMKDPVMKRFDPIW